MNHFFLLPKNKYYRLFLLYPHMSIHKIHRFSRLLSLQLPKFKSTNSSLLLQQQRRHIDTSRPFPPPQPTRPIDHLEEPSAAKPLMSTTMNAVDEDPTLHNLKDPNPPAKIHHFDTYELLKLLESQGFTRKQAEIIMKGIKFRLREW
jgi:hypothetical protein